MQFIVFVILYPILWLISILPFRLLYILSDGVYFSFTMLLATAKSSSRKYSNGFATLIRTRATFDRKKFYHHLCDLFLEMIKTMTISEKELDRRYTFTNIDLYLDLEKTEEYCGIVGTLCFL